MKDYIAEWWIIYLVCLLLIALVTFLGFAMVADNDHRIAFMAECEQHEPHYRCEYLWRSSEPEVYPVVVPIYSGK